MLEVLLLNYEVYKLITIYTFIICDFKIKRNKCIFLHTSSDFFLRANNFYSFFFFSRHAFCSL